MMNSSRQLPVASRQWPVISSRWDIYDGLSLKEKSSFNREKMNGSAALSTGNWRLATESGVILIALLWVLVALSVIALSFSRESFVEVAAARNTQSLETAYFIARAGIVSTIYHLMEKRRKPSVQQAELQETPDPIELGIVTGNFGGGSYRVEIQDESGKININTISEEQLRLLIEASGINKQDGDIIVDSVLDWRDGDDLYRLNGAEDDYYQSLDLPYNARNGRIETVEELLLIRGITPDYFYGHPERTPDGSVIFKYGLSRCFTVYATRTLNRINVNYAPLPVLLSIPGMPLQAATMICERRLTKPFKNLAEVTREIPVPLGANVLTRLSVEQTGVFTLTASARSKNSKARRIIRTVVTLDRGNNAEYKTLYWNENVPYYEGMTP
jgi:general secretion pathway protein K